MGGASRDSTGFGALDASKVMSLLLNILLDVKLAFKENSDKMTEE